MVIRFEKMMKMMKMMMLTFTFNASCYSLLYFSFPFFLTKGQHKEKEKSKIIELRRWRKVIEGWRKIKRRHELICGTKMNTSWQRRVCVFVLDDKTVETAKLRHYLKCRAMSQLMAPKVTLSFTMLVHTLTDT